MKILETGIHKKWDKRSLSISLLLLFLVFISACNGQENNSLRKVSATDTTINDKQHSKISWVDPLFYIDGQLCAWVRNIHQDKKGNLWLATNHYGIMYYDGDSLQYFDEKDGLGLGRVTGIVEDQEGNIWIGTAGGLTKYNGQTFSNFSKKDGLTNDEIWDVIIDRKGLFWIGTMEGIFQFDGETFTTFPIPKAEVKDTNTILSYNRITCLLEDKNGTIWIGTDGFGICRFDGQAFTHFTKKDGLCDNNVSDLLEDSMGNIWIGTMYGGVSRYDRQSFTNFTQLGMVEGIEVGGLYEDKSGNIWFAAEHSGVYRYEAGNEDSFTNFHKKNGLNSSGILSIFEDREGRFWLGGWGGLFRYDGHTFKSVTKDGTWK